MADPTVDRHSANPGHEYARVSSQGPNRFQACSFLAGITFAAFASILAGRPLTLTRAWPTSGLLAIDGLLGAATVALLLATLGAYAALHDLSDITQQQADAQEPGAVAVVTRCYDTYHRAGDLLAAAVVSIILALLILGFYVSPLVGAVTLVAVPLALWHLRLYQDHMAYGVPSWFPGAREAAGQSASPSARGR
jgi:hypothetical protein